MEELELTSTEDLVRRFAPQLVPQLGDCRLDSYVVSGITSMTVAVTLLSVINPPQAGAAGGVVVALAGGILAAGFGVAEIVARRRHRRDLTFFYKQVSSSPWKLYEAVARNFEQQIHVQRARTLGADSDWGHARKPLENAVQETARSVAYWEQRVAMDPGNEVAQQQRETALRLRAKFQEALTKLDERAQFLVTFFNECEARLAVLQYAQRDHEEMRKLGALSERADDIVIDASKTLAAIGNTFLSEAIRVGNALGGLERVGWLSVADTVHVDRIETLADRILESSQHEREMLDRLTKEIQP